MVGFHRDVLLIIRVELFLGSENFLKVRYFCDSDVFLSHPSAGVLVPCRQLSLLLPQHLYKGRDGCVHMSTEYKLMTLNDALLLMYRFEELLVGFFYY